MPKHEDPKSTKSTKSFFYSLHQKRLTAKWIKANKNLLVSLVLLASWCLIPRPPSTQLLHQQTRIMPPKPKAVGQRIRDLQIPRLVRNIIQITLRVRIIQVDRRRHQISISRQRRDHRL